MTPSPNQRASSDDEFASEAEKIVHQKNQQTIFAVIAGIQDPDRAQEYVKAAGDCDQTGPQIVKAAFDRRNELLDLDRDADAEAERGESAA